MTTQTRHGIVKLHKLFNLHTSSYNYISFLLTSHIDALNYPNWKMIMKEENHILIENKTPNLVHCPSNDNFIQSFWIFKHKNNFDGSFEPCR